MSPDRYLISLMKSASLFMRITKHSETLSNRYKHTSPSLGLFRLNSCAGGSPPVPTLPTQISACLRSFTSKSCDGSDGATRFIPSLPSLPSLFFEVLAVPQPPRSCKHTRRAGVHSFSGVGT